MITPHLDVQHRDLHPLSLHASTEVVVHEVQGQQDLQTMRRDWDAEVRRRRVGCGGGLGCLEGVVAGTMDPVQGGYFTASREDSRKMSPKKRVTE